MILIVFAFSGVAAAKNKNSSPESIMTCGDFQSLVESITVPPAIDLSQCKLFDPDNPCAPCLISLEAQKCKIIDVVVTYDQLYAQGVATPHWTYLLSCVRP